MKPVQTEDIGGKTAGELAAELAASGERWMLAMRRGDFAAAWRETDRWELPRRRAEADGVFARAAHHLQWNGRPFTGKRVLVRCEHGLGDTIQFIRYAPLLREQAARVTVRAQPALLELLECVEGIDEVLDAWTTEPEPEHDVAIECMELAYAFRHTTDAVPARVPYLEIAKVLGRAHPLRMASDGRVKIGLVWAASEWDPRRSIPLEQFAGLAGLPVQIASLQQGTQREQARAASFSLLPLSRQTERVIDAAAAMLAMDLIITVDSMTAHLAGALGCPVFLLLNVNADWRWMAERPDSPWYPTMRIFRQATAGAWEGVMCQVRTAMEERFACRRWLSGTAI